MPCQGLYLLLHQQHIACFFPSQEVINRTPLDLTQHVALQETSANGIQAPTSPALLFIAKLNCHTSWVPGHTGNLATPKLLQTDLQTGLISVANFFAPAGPSGGVEVRHRLSEFHEHATSYMICELKADYPYTCCLTLLRVMASCVISLAHVVMCQGAVWWPAPSPAEWLQ